jgi:hypothetical protein
MCGAGPVDRGGSTPSEGLPEPLAGVVEEMGDGVTPDAATSPSHGNDGACAHAKNFSVEIVTLCTPIFDMTYSPLCIIIRGVSTPSGGLPAPLVGVLQEMGDGVTPKAATCPSQGNDGVCAHAKNFSVEIVTLCTPILYMTYSPLCVIIRGASSPSEGLPARLAGVLQKMGDSVTPDVAASPSNGNQGVCAHTKYAQWKPRLHRRTHN